MSRGYWCIVLATVGWLTLVGASQPQASPPNPGPGPRVGDALTNISTGFERREKDEARSPDKRPCQDVDQDRYSDLCAQWTAAKAAKKSSDWADLTGFLSVGSFLLSVLGLVALICTLRQTNKSLRLAQKDRATATLRALASEADTKRALKIAENNAESAAKSADIAEKSLIISQRAYLAIHEIKWMPIDGLGIRIEIFWKNTGATSAINGRWHLSWFHFDGGLPENFQYPNLGTDNGEIITMHSGVILSQKIINIPEGIANQAVQKIKRIFFCSWVEYDDLFTNERHRIEVCDEIVVNLGQPVTFTSYGPFNREFDLPKITTENADKY